MSYYYKYNFISPEPVYALIKEEFKSYMDTGAVDDLLFGTWTDKCLRKLGKTAYYITETVLRISDFEARLPDNFYSVREAWLCTNVDSINYQLPNSFYSQAHSIQTIKVSPMTTNEPCEGDCLPNTIQAVYKTNNSLTLNFQMQYLLKPGNISVRDNCDLECANFGSSAVDSFDIRNNKFVTNFREGFVYLIFYAKEYDETGYQMIPDNYRIREYIEAFIKYKLMEQLSNQVIDETAKQIENKLQRYKMESDEAYVLADIEIKKQPVNHKIRAIKNQLNSFNMFELPQKYIGRNGWRRN